MFHDRGQRHRERLGKGADGKARLLSEPRQQGPPGGIGERGKGAVEWLGAILNHEVKHTTICAAVKLARRPTRRSMCVRAVDRKRFHSRSTARMSTRE